MTATAPTRSLIIEREVPHPPEKIWRALTQSSLVEEWLMKNDFQPVVGHRFNFRSTPVPGWNGVIDAEGLGGERNSRLSLRGPCRRPRTERMSAWNKPASGRNKMPPTRVRRTDGRNSSATWSVSLGGWTDHEREIHCLLDDYRTRCVFHERGRYAGGTI